MIPRHRQKISGLVEKEKREAQMTMITADHSVRTQAQLPQPMLNVSTPNMLMALYTHGHRPDYIGPQDTM